ncbi:MAG: DNA polymerase III subunit beta [Firmicutes bacterium]|nr:DNA polymerase III subunit beta [Bacillota bacterium]
MLFSLSQTFLSEHLQIVAKAIATRSTIPGLDGILFECDGNDLILTATNMELGIQTRFPAVHKEKGRVVLPGKIVDIVRHLSAESVQIKVNLDNYLTEIKSGQAEFQLYGQNADDYPVFPTVLPEQKECSFNIKSGELRRLLRQTLFAVSQDESKLAFTGVLFTLSGNLLTLSSSDTFRLATTSCHVTAATSDATFLVPAKNLQEVLRIFAAEDRIIEAVLQQNQLFLTSGTTCLSSRLLEENFPDVQRVIPQKIIGKASINTANFIKALERATLLAEGTNHVVRFSIGENTMVIRASSKYGKIQEQLPISLSGEGVEIAFNARFLLEALKIIESEEFILEITGTNKPCIIKDPLAPGYLYLVLPIKIKNKLK